MSKNKSLGSSPIGYTSDNSSKMDFIPDLGVSKSDKSASKSSNGSPSSKPSQETSQQQETDPQPEKSEKKVVSYSLEMGLVTKIKTVAEQNEMYYSTLVSKILKNWLSKNS